MLCQHLSCTKEAKWRIVDKYTQQGMEFVYFYYMCDEHKTSKECPGHKKTIQPLQPKGEKGGTIGGDERIKA